MENNDNKNSKQFKSLYQDGLLPTKEYHKIAKDVSKIIDTLFKTYIDEGYSPREISELMHACVGVVCSEKSLLLTIKRKAEVKKSLKKDE